MPQSRQQIQQRLDQLLQQLPSQHVDLSGYQLDQGPASLADQACLVTGGASGLGKAFTEALASKGAYVAFLDIDAAGGASLESKLRQQGNYNVKFIQADVTSWKSQVAALEIALRHAPKGRINHFIANAGVGGHRLNDHMFARPRTESANDLPPPALGAINISLIGSYYTLCLASHHFVNSSGWKDDATSDKSIVFLGSMSSYRSIPVGTDYAAAKFGMRGLFTSTRETMGMYKLNVRVNMLSPQFIETPMNKTTKEWYENAGYRFCDIRHAVTALVRMIEDRTVQGRSISINQEEGPHDLDDDVSGYDGQLQVQRLLKAGLLPTWRY